jgi:hypothetical protein
MYVNILCTVVRVTIYIRAYMPVVKDFMYDYTVMYYVRLTFQVLEHY